MESQPLAQLVTWESDREAFEKWCIDNPGSTAAACNTANTTWSLTEIYHLLSTSAKLVGVAVSDTEYLTIHGRKRN